MGNETSTISFQLPLDEASLAGLSPMDRQVTKHGSGQWFHLRRTSGISDETPPHERAVKRPYVRVDERLVDDPREIPARKGQDPKWWYAEGRNHRVEHGSIMRDFDAESWFIQIDSLDELMEFVRLVGTVVLEHDYFGTPGPTIEIYDDYRE